MEIIREIFDWSEVWAGFLPLTIFFIRKPAHRWVKPVIIYLFIAVICSLIIDIIWKRLSLGLDPWFKANFPGWYEADGVTIKNTIFYNIISISRLLLFTWFFHYIGPVFKKLNRIVPLLFLVLVAVNFTIFENIEDFSSRLFTLETGLLLLYCIVFFFSVMRDETSTITASRPVFLVVTGLSIYVAVNFFIFLFFKQLTYNFSNFAMQIWDYHNLSNIIFCIFIAIAFFKK